MSGGKYVKQKSSFNVIIKQELLMSFIPTTVHRKYNRGDDDIWNISFYRVIIFYDTHTHISAKI